MQSEGVKWTYYKPVGNKTFIGDAKLELVAGDWGACSKTCGGGKFKKKYLWCLFNALNVMKCAVRRVFVASPRVIKF